MPSDADSDRLSTFPVSQSRFLPALSVQDTYQAVTTALSEYLSILPAFVSQALPGATLGCCLRYCKTSSQGSPHVRGEVRGDLLWLCQAYTDVLGNSFALSIKTMGCPAGKGKE